MLSKHCHIQGPRLLPWAARVRTEYFFKYLTEGVKRMCVCAQVAPFPVVSDGVWPCVY